MITGPTKVVVKLDAETLHTDKGVVKKAEKKQEVSFKVSSKVRKGDNCLC